MDNKVVAIIVTYNSDIDVLVSQYQNLVSQVEGIVYVDNGSANYDEIIENLTRIVGESKGVKYIHNEINKGLGYAHNQGVELAGTLRASSVLILDHDSIVEPSFVQNLLDAKHELENKGEAVGAVGPIYCNVKTGEIYPITKYWGPFIKRMQPTRFPVEASVLISSGTLISMEVLKNVGGMHEGLFVDYIDIEWSYRARKKGYKLYAVPKAVMNHQIGDNRMSIFGRKISVHSPLRRYFLARNSIHMLKCPYVSWGYKLRELTFNILRIVVFALISDTKMEYLKYSFKGLRDGLHGIYGKCTID